MPLDIMRVDQVILTQQIGLWEENADALHS